MLIKDKDLLVEEKQDVSSSKKSSAVRIDKKNMRAAWGDAFDYYIRGITERYLKFHGRATRLEFWGFFMAECLFILLLMIVAQYIEMPMLPYYYILATAIPFVAVAARRLHDTNKNAFLYLGLWVITFLSAIFIRFWAIIPIILWLLLLIKLFSLPTDVRDGFYGIANENDEVYGEDNIRIIRKFRLLSVILATVCLVLTYLNFDNWTEQNSYKATKDNIMEQISTLGEKQGLTAQQVHKAEEIMKQTLKNWNGKEVQPEDITKAIENAVAMARPKPVKEEE